MAFYLSPQAKVQEIDLSTTIPAVATSIACIVLRDTYKGPEMTQELVTSVNGLVDKFGISKKRIYDHAGDDIVSANCYQDMASAMGYLKYGNKLYCTRVMSPSATFAGTILDDGGSWTGFETADALTLNTEYMSGDITDPDEFADEISDSGLMGTDHLWMIASSRGYWGNRTRIALVDKTTQTEMLSGANSSWDTYDIITSVDSILENDDDFLIIVQNKPQGSTLWGTVETWNVSLSETAIDEMGINKFVETSINNGSNYIRIALLESQKNEDTVPTEWVTQFFVTLSGGADYDGSDTVTKDAIMEGYNLYKNPEEIDINIFIDSNKHEDVKRELVVICESRLDAMAIIDCRYEDVIKNKGGETSAIVNWRKNTNSPDTWFNQNTSRAALYGNWFNIYDKYIKEYLWVPVSGYMAGLFARTDNMRDPWWAPAGLNRAIITGVRKLAWNPSLGDRDILYMNGINPIVSFAGQGKVVWGQKTLLDKSSAFNRINVRRLFIVLEKAISTASKYFIFEQNDRFTWAQMKGMIEPFLRDVKSRRGIYDFYVQIDEENNTPERIDRNELWASIFIKPTRTAEFIVLQFVATKTGANFSELIGSV